MEEHRVGCRLAPTLSKSLNPEGGVHRIQAIISGSLTLAADPQRAEQIDRTLDFRIRVFF